MVEAKASETLILSSGDVNRVLDMGACIQAVEDAFRTAGGSIESKILGFHLPTGGIHVKCALDRGTSPAVFAGKINANFPENPSRGLPTIQGVIALFDAEQGRVLALMDSISLTVLRTAAASAVAAKALSNPKAQTLGIIGCGAQAGAHLRAMKEVRPLTSVTVFDTDASKAADFAATHSTLSLPVKSASSGSECARDSDIVVTCTSSAKPFLRAGDVTRGAFVAAVGADSDTKNEITPELMASAAIFTDSTEQCASIGDLHHAIKSGFVSRESVSGELTEVLNGRVQVPYGETIIFDSTGVAFQDVVSANLVYTRAVQLGLGLRVHLSH